MWKSIGQHNQGFNNALHAANELQSVKEELRGTRSALPEDTAVYLNDLQSVVLQNIANFGWELAFIRRPLFMPPLVVIKNTAESRFAVLEDDGTVNLSPDIHWRH